MKNIFRFLMAVAVLFTASCAKEDISSSIGGGEANVTFTVDLPELGTRAYADGTKATTLRYYVFDGDNYLPGISSESLPEKKVTLTNGKAVVTLPLLKGMIYNIIFWADKDGCYTIDTDTKTVTVDYTGAYANDDNRDAFYKYLSKVDPTDAVEIKKQTDVTLTRPFGQLNAATSDFDTVEKNEVTLTTSTIRVKANKTLDLTTGIGSNQDTFSFEPTAIPTETLKNGYKYLSMNYLIPGNVNAEFTFKGTRNNGSGSEVTFTGTSYTNVPVKANYRTNILGALLTMPTEFTVEVKPGFGGEEVYDVEDVHVATAEELVDAIDTVAATGGEIVLVEDIELSDILVITSTPASRTANAEDKVITLDGNGKKLISTAGRAINVSGAENVIIKNLIIECSGERAINVIQNAKSVTIENVIATAANYTVNVAGSAPNAVVAINNSTLTGLCTVNVAGAGAKVTLDNCTVNCNDNNTTEGESYAALSLNKDAVGGSIIATNTTVNVAEGSDSTKGRNGAENGTVTINGSTDDVSVMVAAITYPNNNYYYSFATLEEAVEFAKAGDTIQLIRDITLAETLVIPADKNISLDLNGKTLAHEDAVNKYALNNHGTLTIKGNGVVNARGIYNGYGNGGENVATAKLIVENGTFNAKGTNGGACIFNYGTAEINGGSFTSIGGYSLNNQVGATMTIADGVTANNGIYCSGASLTINGGEIKGNRSGCHVVYAWDAKVTINGGAIHNNNSGNSTIMAAGSTEMTINGGTFSIKDGRVPGNGNTWTSCLTDTANSATLTVNDGTFNGGFRVQAGTTMTINGGSFNDCYGSNYNIYGTAVVKGGTYTDDAAKAFAKKHVAEGYKINKNGEVVPGNYYDSAIVDWDGVLYEGEIFSSAKENTLWLNNLVFGGDAAIKVENKTYNAIVVENCSGEFKNDVITIANDNSSVMILQNLNFTLAEGKKLIKSVNKIYQVFMTNITINGVKMTDETIAQYLENVEWYQVVEEI